MIWEPLATGDFYIMGIENTSEPLVHRTPSVGSILKRMIEINPELSASELTALIRESILDQSQAGLAAGEFAQAQVIDEAKCLRLTRESVQSSL